MPQADQDEDSVVMVVAYGENRFLFTSDIGPSTERTTLSGGVSVGADVLKVAHHGSKYSSSTAFLEAVGAEVAVICVGANPYGHPAQAALNRLSAAGAQSQNLALFSTARTSAFSACFKARAGLGLASGSS